MQEAFLYDHGKRYRLFAWAVMPNHAHVLFKAKSGEELSKLTHTWKSLTAKRINGVLERRGKLWQAQSFDHLVRSAEAFERICQYVFDNPKKAGLVDWNWMGRLDEVATPTIIPNELSAGRREYLR